MKLWILTILSEEKRIQLCFTNLHTSPIIALFQRMNNQLYFNYTIFYSIQKINSKKNWKIFYWGTRTLMPIRRRCCRPMCIPFHEVDLSVTIEHWVERGTRTLKCFHLRGFADRFLTIRTSQHIFLILKYVIVFPLLHRICLL